MLHRSIKKQDDAAIKKFLENGGLITLCPPGPSKKLSRRGYVWATTRTKVNLKNAGYSK